MKLDAAHASANTTRTAMATISYAEHRSLLEQAGFAQVTEVSQQLIKAVKP